MRRLLPAVLLACACAGTPADDGAAEPAPAPVVEEPAAPAAEPTLDDLVQDMWDAAEVDPAPAVDDAGFLRRASLDLTGRVPEPHVVRAFLSDRAPDKRAQLVKTLLASDGFVEHWTEVFRDWFVREEARFRPVFRESATAYFQGALRDGVPYDRFVSDMLTASGAVGDNGATVFLASHRQGNTPEVLTANVLETVVGRSEYQCAQCHDHPTLDEIKQEDFFGVVAFFARMRVRRPPEKGGERGALQIRDRPRGQLRRKPEGADAEIVIQPRFLDGKPWRDQDGNRRRALARALVTSPDFATTLVDRAWAQMFGAPLAHRGRHVRARLAEGLRAHDHDLRWLLAELAGTRAYGRAARGGETRGTLSPADVFARSRVRPLEPHVLIRVLFQATSVEPAEPHFFPRARLERRMGASQRMVHEAFRDTSGEDADLGDTAAQALMLINGAITNRGSLLRPGSRLQFLFDVHADERKRLEGLYLLTYGREPEADERRHDETFIRSRGGRRSAWEDLMYGMLLSTEFLTNH